MRSSPFAGGGGRRARGREVGGTRFSSSARESPPSYGGLKPSLSHRAAPLLLPLPPPANNRPFPRGAVLSSLFAPCSLFFFSFQSPSPRLWPSPFFNKKGGVGCLTSVFFLNSDFKKKDIQLAPLARCCWLGSPVAFHPSSWILYQLSPVLCSYCSTNTHFPFHFHFPPLSSLPLLLLLLAPPRRHRSSSILRHRSLAWPFFGKDAFGFW